MFRISKAIKKKITWTDRELPRNQQFTIKFAQNKIESTGRKPATYFGKAKAAYGGFEGARAIFCRLHLREPRSGGHFEAGSLAGCQGQPWVILLSMEGTESLRQILTRLELNSLEYSGFSRSFW